MTGWRLALWFAMRPKLWRPTLSMAMHLAYSIYQAALVKSLIVRSRVHTTPDQPGPHIRDLEGYEHLNLGPLYDRSSPEAW